MLAGDRRGEVDGTLVFLLEVGLVLPVGDTMGGEMDGPLLGKLDGPLDDPLPGKLDGPTDGPLLGKMGGLTAGKLDGELAGEKLSMPVLSS